MSVLRFTASGDLKLDKNIKYVRATINISWNDESALWGTALKSLSFNDDNNTVQWSTNQDSGNASRNFKISGNTTSATDVSVSYQSQNTPLSIDKKSDTKLEFRDGEGTDANATVTLSIEEVVRFEATPPPPGTTPPEATNTIIDNTGGCPPGPWSEPVPPSCGSPPTGLSSNDGLQVTKTGQSQITLNLKNYANKLVSLKITHQVDADWTQGFNFSIPNCSDISPNTGGAPYAKNGYSNSNITGTNTFYVYNIDGGDYNYVFNHSSVSGPAPWRQLFTQASSTSCDAEGNCVTTYYCVEAGIENFSPWPYCPVGVAISKNGGNKVQWQYEDGGGGSYDDQYVTVEVISVRSAIGSTGSICTSALKNSVWLNDSADPAANGNCISDYKDHSQKVRFRIPSLKSSKLTFPTPLCYQQFRGIAGAIPPGEQLGSVSSEYSVLHLFDRDFKTTTSLVSGSGIIVDSLGETDAYISPYNEVSPSTNANLGITARKHYLVQFTDGTVVNPGATNISISVGQSVTADGLNVAPVFFKKEQVSANSLRVWFYLNYQQNQQQTDDIIHVFDDTTNITNTVLSELEFEGITVVPQALTDPGNGTAGYETLNAINKKHYLITFTDSTIVSADASNIVFEINQNKTASGESYRINLVRRERVNDKSLRVWFTAYNTTSAPGLETDNAFVRDFSISRTRVENFSGNIFARSWYLSKSV